MKRQLELFFDLPDDPLALLDPNIKINGTNRGSFQNDPLRKQEELQRSKLQEALSLLCHTKVTVILTDNSNSLIRVKRGYTGWLTVRLHHMFLEADPEVVICLARFIVHGDRNSSQQLDDFIKEHRDEIAPPTARNININAQGVYFNLQEIYDEINLHYFQNTIHAQITWGRNVRKRRRVRMQMGSYSGSQKLIRIHPALDQSFVPRYYVAWVIYHEMLHAHFGVDMRNAVTGRRIIHPAKLEFAEKEFEHYEKAHLWEMQNIGRLMKF